MGIKWIIMVDFNEEKWRVGSLKFEKDKQLKLGFKKLMVNLTI